MNAKELAQYEQWRANVDKILDEMTPKRLTQVYSTVFPDAQPREMPSKTPFLPIYAYNPRDRNPVKIPSTLMAVPDKSKKSKK